MANSGDGGLLRVQGKGESMPSWKAAARLAWFRMLHWRRHMRSHSQDAALPARQPSPTLTPQASKRQSSSPQILPQSGQSMSAVPLKSDWQLSAHYVDAGSSSARPSLEGDHQWWHHIDNNIPIFIPTSATFGLNLAVVTCVDPSRH